MAVNCWVLTFCFLAVVSKFISHTLHLWYIIYLTTDLQKWTITFQHNCSLHINSGTFVLSNILTGLYFKNLAVSKISLNFVDSFNSLISWFRNYWQIFESVTMYLSTGFHCWSSFWIFMRVLKLQANRFATIWENKTLTNTHKTVFLTLTLA